MKTKLLSSSWSAESLETKMNNFLSYLEDNGNEVIEIQYSPTIFSYQAMIVYK
ncbi:hypothetical protein ACWN8V_00465 [Vagococcus elongatus]|uniref:hypothetical protein n=1 Tax=Vagococcus elongatus TaxID=180344 RepID=UPI00147782AE|nr:hypothetical protein [Vagococcus elongatus]